MIDTHYPTVDQLMADKRSRKNLLFVAFLLMLLLVFGVAVGLDLMSPNMPVPAKLGAGFAIFIAVSVPVIIWMKPLRGVQCIFLMCMIIENDGRMPPFKLPTSYLPFFLNFNLIGNTYGTGVLEPVKFSPAEAIMVLAFGSWLIRSIAKREFHWRSGAFAAALLAFISWVTFGFVHGLTTGGDFLLALWEVRAMYLCVAMYFITANLVRDREQLKTFAWIIVIGLGLRSLLGLYAYTQLKGQITDQGILAHEDSMMFNLLFFLPAILCFNRGPSKLIWASLLIIPIALFVDIENNRRAGIAAFVVAFIALIVLAWFLLPQRKAQLRLFIIITAFVSALYFPVAWNAQGQWAFPAKALKSQFSPDERDAGSDNYRYMEDFDLKATRDLSPWIGIGYGKAWMEVIPLPRVSTGFLQYIAHDSVLWMWMRLGHVGFLLFMFVIAQIMIKGPQFSRPVRDPLTQMFGIMAVLYMIMIFIFGKYDTQFADYRTMITLGFFAGILGVLPKLAEEPGTVPAANKAAALPRDPDLLPELDKVPADLRLYQ
jgi:hypothetical protein